MAGAETACASARADTILGITRSIANPAYRRLAQIEPWLRLAVPAFLGLFLITLAGSAWIQVQNNREEAVLDAFTDIDVHRHARGSEVRLEARALRSRGGGRPARQPGEGAAVRCARSRRTLLLVNDAGSVMASYPQGASVPRSLTDLFGEAQPLMLFADRAGVMNVKLADGQDGIATVRALPASSGQIAVVQARSQVLAGWMSRSLGLVLLLGATALVLLGTGLAYFLQANRPARRISCAKRCATGSTAR
jgi:two-component system cell cycle sensor histidine kinase PleC